ncbi:MAG TPA: hypothetical protein PKC76_13375 [Saprospiraceae bacterium]|nr:hypothetical protein [Saprospiraceae bacterium]HMP25124.1 hypothetical protein [Saprospiraceae bacterium]
MKSTLLITLAFIFIHHVKAQDSIYQRIAYQTERDSGNLTAKKQDEEIKNRKNMIYGSVGAWSLGLFTGKLSYQRKIFNFLSLKSSIGRGAYFYGFPFVYDVGPIVSLGSKSVRFVSGALLYGYVDSSDSPVFFAIPFGIEIYNKKGFYILPQGTFIQGDYNYGTFVEIQLGIGASF